MKGKGEVNAIVVILIVLLVASIGFNVYQYNNQQQDSTTFFDDYVIAVNDYHIANSFFDLGNTNLDTGIWYIETEEYYYDSAIDYLDLAKEQLTDAKALLIHSERKLKGIENKAPNKFYEQELQNRIEQNKVMLSVTDKYFLLVDYMDKQLYEINYGSETEATRYFNMYNDLIVEANEDLVKLSDISQEIDLNWNSDWYPLLEGS